MSGPPAGLSLDAWWAQGRRESVRLPGGEYEIFVHICGEGPCLTLLHGFPASSYEWAQVVPALAAHHRVISFDFLGFGASDKPTGHRYSVLEQADVVQALWHALGVTETAVVAYDYGAIVAQELLARGLGTELETALTRLILLNAGLDSALYRPRPAQRLSITPVLGALLTKLFTERIFTRTWSEVFSAEHPLDPAVAAEHYRALRHGDAARDVQRRLLAYIPERVAHRARLEGALSATAVPLHFLWGMADPVSGAQIAGSLRRRFSALDLVEYADAGHVPHLEIPDRVAADILARITVGG